MKSLLVRILDSKLAVYNCYLTGHCFHAKVLSPTFNSYGKRLQQSIMTLLTPKLGIVDISTKSEHISRKYKISMRCISTFTAGSLYLNTH